MYIRHINEILDRHIFKKKSINININIYVHVMSNKNFDLGVGFFISLPFWDVCINNTPEANKLVICNNPKIGNPCENAG